MDSFETNKILGAILGTLLFVMGVGFAAEAIYHPIEERGPGYALPEPEPVAAESEGGAAAAATPIGVLLASANPEDGAASAKKCGSCHDFTSGGPNKTGPNLYDVVERMIASHPGFDYSAALKEHGSDVWSYENLDHFLLSPKGFAPGTKMTFAGIKDDAERANVIAYLSTLSASPKPFPAAEAPGAEAAAVPAEVPQTIDAVESNTETQSETPVAGTPTTSGTGGDTAPTEQEAPAPGAADVTVPTPSNSLGNPESTQPATSEAPAAAPANEATPANAAAPATEAAPAAAPEAAPANAATPEAAPAEPAAPANAAAPAETTPATETPAPATETPAPANTSAPANTAEPQAAETLPQAQPAETTAPATPAVVAPGEPVAPATAAPAPDAAAAAAETPINTPASAQGLDENKPVAPATPAVPANTVTVSPWAPVNAL